jgi:hypothetical protein
MPINISVYIEYRGLIREPRREALREEQAMAKEEGSYELGVTFVHPPSCFAGEYGRGAV